MAYPKFSPKHFTHFPPPSLLLHSAPLDHAPAAPHSALSRRRTGNDAPHFTSNKPLNSVESLGPSLHTGGSIPMTEHRRRLVSQLGEEPSHEVLFQASHKRKNTNDFVCKKAQRVMETVSQMQQTQPKLEQATAWYETTGGLKKGDYVFRFGSDTKHYFPKVARQRKSRYGESSSHAACVACEERIKQLEQTHKEIIEQNKKIMELFQVICSAHPELLQSAAPTAYGNQSSGVGLDNLNVNDESQSSS